MDHIVQFCDLLVRIRDDGISRIRALRAVYVFDPIDVFGPCVRGQDNLFDVSCREFLSTLYRAAHFGCANPRVICRVAEKERSAVSDPVVKVDRPGCCFCGKVWRGVSGSRAYYDRYYLKYHFFQAGLKRGIYKRNTLNMCFDATTGCAMILTSYSNYAMRSLQLAALKAPDLVRIDDVARIHNLSRPHIMKIVHQLGKAGYFETVRGRGGGAACAGGGRDRRWRGNPHHGRSVGCG